MNKFLKILKTVGWAVILPFAWIILVIKYYSLVGKSKKYTKNPKDFMDHERYGDVYKLVKIIKIVKRFKIEKSTGKEKLLSKSQLIVANHKSKHDPLIMFMFCYEQLNNNFIFVAKKELLTHKYAPIFKYINTIFLDRENLRDAIRVLEEERVLLTKGKTVVIFPEGTRNDGEELLEFKSGAFEPAYKSMCPIQPIILANVETYNGEPKVEKKPILIKIMEPIQPNKFITIDRTIFANNLRKEMQKEYSALKTKK
ncbi:MAG: lysophospholipid acyltransferase family protein [Mycoplasma sp.]